MKGENFRLSRLAPTPSGYLHLGNAFSFVLTAGLARRHGARLLLRIDDLDQQRVSESYLDDVFETLDFLGIDWQMGPRNREDFVKRFSQTLRLAHYQKWLNELREKNLVYACTCSRSQLQTMSGQGPHPCNCRQKNLPLDSPGAAWRFKTSLSAGLTVNTLKGIVKTTLPQEMSDFVVRKKDGMPAYQLSSLADDVYFGVDFIVRGQDLWPSTLAQLLLARELGLKSFEESTFYHHALIKNPAGEKLSKSAGDTSLRHYRQSGISRGEFYKLLAANAGAGEEEFF